MAKCSKCGDQISIFKQKHEFQNGDVYCTKCYSEWEAKEAKLREKEEEEKVKKALSKNCKWEYKVIQMPTEKGGLVASLVADDTKINPQEQLDELGKQGWELVSAMGMQSYPGDLRVSSPGTTTSVLFIFKRKI